MFRLNIRISAEEMSMLQDLKLALFLATDSSVVRHLITEGYAAEHGAIEAAKQLKAATDKRQLRLPIADAPMGSESVLEGESVGATIARADATVGLIADTAATVRKQSFHERRADLARKKKKQAKERGHKSRGLVIPKRKRGAQ